MVLFHALDIDVSTYLPLIWEGTTKSTGPSARIDCYLAIEHRMEIWPLYDCILLAIGPPGHCQPMLYGRNLIHNNNIFIIASITLGFAG